MQLSKKDTANGFYDDGLVYLFTKQTEDGQTEVSSVKPRHISFEAKFLASVDGSDGEACNLRLYSV